MSKCSSTEVVAVIRSRYATVDSIMSAKGCGVFLVSSWYRKNCMCNSEVRREVLLHFIEYSRAVLGINRLNWLGHVLRMLI